MLVLMIEVHHCDLPLEAPADLFVELLEGCVSDQSFGTWVNEYLGGKYHGTGPPVVWYIVALREYGCSNFCSQWVCREYLLHATTTATGCMVFTSPTSVNMDVNSVLIFSNRPIIQGQGGSHSHLHILFMFLKFSKKKSDIRAMIYINIRCSYPLDVQHLLIWIHYIVISKIG